jgi:hypothetical protein
MSPLKPGSHARPWARGTSGGSAKVTGAWWTAPAALSAPPTRPPSTSRIGSRRCVANESSDRCSSWVCSRQRGPRSASTVYRILVRRGISRLRDLDVTGEDLRGPVVRYEWSRPGAWSMSTSRSWGGSLRAAAIGSTAAPRPSTEPRGEPRPVELGPASSSSTRPWTITPA